MVVVLQHCIEALTSMEWVRQISTLCQLPIVSEVSRCSFCYCCIRHFRCKNVYHKLSYAMLGVRSAWWAFVFSLILRSFSPCQVGGNLNSFRSFKVFFLLPLYQTFFRCKNVYHKLSYAMLGVRSAWWAFVFSLILRSFSPYQVGGNLNSSSSLVNWMWKVRLCVNLAFLAAKIFSYHVSSPRNPIFDHSEWLVHACLGSIRKDHWDEWSEGQRHARQTVPLPSCQSSCHRSHFKIFTRKKSTIVLKPKHTSDPAPHGFKTLAWKDFSNCCQFPHRETGSWMCCAAATFQI